MVLEATMICVDNSEYMRNGDYFPTRFQAQSEGVRLLCVKKTQPDPAIPESVAQPNAVGILRMAGGGGNRVLIAPTSDLRSF